MDPAIATIVAAGIGLVSAIAVAFIGRGKHTKAPPSAPPTPPAARMPLPQVVVVRSTDEAADQRPFKPLRKYSPRYVGQVPMEPQLKQRTAIEVIEAVKAVQPLAREALVQTAYAGRWVIWAACIMAIVKGAQDGWFTVLVRDPDGDAPWLHARLDVGPEQWGTLEQLMEGDIIEYHAKVTTVRVEEARIDLTSVDILCAPNRSGQRPDS